jgi:hypothetical protein
MCSGSESVRLQARGTLESPVALLVSATESDGPVREPLACWTSSPPRSFSRGKSVHRSHRFKAGEGIFAFVEDDASSSLQTTHGHGGGPEVLCRLPTWSHGTPLGECDQTVTQYTRHNAIIPGSPGQPARLASAPRREAVWPTGMASSAALGFVCCRSDMSPPCPRGLHHVPAREPRPAADGREGMRMCRELPARGSCLKVIYWTSNALRRRKSSRTEIFDRSHLPRVLSTLLAYDDTVPTRRVYYLPDLYGGRGSAPSRLAPAPQPPGSPGSQQTAATWQLHHVALEGEVTV